MNSILKSRVEQKGTGGVMNKPPVYEGNEPYIFVSYAHIISDRAMEIIRLLSSNGYRLWYDEGLVIGEAYDDLIAEKIEKCAAFLCLLSNEYGKSSFCKWEFNYAVERRRKVCIPVYLDDIEKVILPGGMDMKLSGIHAVIYKGDVEVILSSLRRSRSANACLGEASYDRTTEPSLKDLQEIYVTKYKNFDYSKAADEDVKWLLMAAEKGLTDAQVMLGDLYFKGAGVLPQDKKEAVKWFRKAAEKGNGHAKYMSGALAVFEKYELL
ncbi:MAG: toll/interleukin-1 receptor domain-containing protein [Blautia sp.]|nr:toll/interleukin-1 receptor domain-containing protein [Blautia sp.]